ncbi:peptide/nickel transport system ATP-binding protein/oligopeptide transport system ATP-binding protein [Albimonas donghaensis]|uniref:Peptide/nickel transport system ATP-binding protein/oligopeptide transport system ATP-binding protein n=1 Tax=Albimonas donghaensis TaxID=356660 RepID=A0A1H2S3F8_9RHOB|nr:ABC transporter ATP-binding protein [Paracoccaceae bacterium]MBR28088.1 ABC transporter ATP-binding protein [Paracoccaceae bacterium]SDW25674.1 peptide/nickel transport system ATP-binding protein/oligopeptide transport system ATP-binding protein [Albimonas donghaensis]
MPLADGAPLSRAPAADPAGEAPVLEVDRLEVVFDTRGGAVHAINGVSFSVRPGELLGVVGESGSGKSVTMMSALDLLPSPPARRTGGAIRYQGRDVSSMGPKALRKLRGGDIGFVFQDPMTSLNPVFTVGYQICEPLRAHLGLSRKQARKRAAELLAMVGIPSPEARLDDYPHQFSGGMRQRVMVAIALSCEPRVIIADEPTTALDVTIQAQILDLVRDLRHRTGAAIVWVTHDLGVIAGIADRVAVMYAGQIVEEAPVAAIFAGPRHPYAAALLETIPDVEGERPERLTTIPGQPPILRAPPAACAFAPRCAHAFDRCHAQNPPLADDGTGHKAACWLRPETVAAAEAGEGAR